ncbi:MAG: hypothetical protein K6F63_03615 [Lachnospiraceae bacterium]|nr:hypothetical protein [Lachnospiraceae bacterium]
MNCPRCGYKIVGHRRRCENCGQDLRPYESLRKLSNKLYNEGLAEAQVRNLSGACDKLKRSLEYNKENIDARNLLGLVYYELGETVAAIVEWVISTNISKNDNPADALLEKVQGDANEFREAKSAVKKFNIALDMAKQGNDDLAMMQLKKVTALNDHYVRAFLLLSLLQIKHGEYENAKKNLKRVLKVDVGNLDARRYMNELRKVAGEKGKPEGPYKNDSGNETDSPFGISKGTPYREDKPNFVAFVTFFIGAVIGVLAIYFFAVHGIRAKLVAENAEETRKLGTQISDLTAKNSSLESEKSILEGRVSDLSSELLYEKKLNAVNYVEFINLCAEFDEIRNNVAEPAKASYEAYLKEKEAAKEAEKSPENVTENGTEEGTDTANVPAEVTDAEPAEETKEEPEKCFGDFLTDEQSDRIEAFYNNLLEFDIGLAGDNANILRLHEEMKKYISEIIKMQENVQP